MELKFSDLLQSISTSIQQAGQAVEQQVAELYFNDFTSISEDGPFDPIARTVVVPDCSGGDSDSKVIKVPITVLRHHNAMTLETVDIKFSFIPSQKDGELYMDITPDLGADEDGYSELSLSYKTREMSEGIARVNDHYIKAL